MGTNNVPDPLMPQIGCSIIHPEEGEFKVTKSLASGPFSDVFKVLHVKSAQKYAMKVEKEQGTIRPVLKLDVYVLTQMTKNHHVEGFPKLICAGRTGYYKYAVMQLVGVDLGKLRRAMPNKCFSPTTAIKAALQTLNRIEQLHDLGWLCRDIKANNFAIGLGPNNWNIIYMLDFGFARRYKTPYNTLLPPRGAAPLLGTIHYAPLASHYNQDQCRRDDLESWLYMIVEMASGPLPWSHLKPMQEHRMIAENKKFIRHGGKDNFFKHCPPGFKYLIDLIDSLGFYERPRYNQLAEMLEWSFDEMKLDKTTPFDWELENGQLIQKAACVGELGESNMASVRLKQKQDDLLKTPPQDEVDEQPPSVILQPNPDFARKPDEPLSKDEQIASLKTADACSPRIPPKNMV